MFRYGFDMYYLILVIPAMLFAMWAQSSVSSAFRRYSNAPCSYTGAQAARRILDANGLQHVRVEEIRGELTDNFDPSVNVVHLSQSVYNRATVAAVGVAAHECGHAIQHATNYGPLTIRTAIIPVTNFGSKLSIPVFVIGLIFGMPGICNIGMLLFGLVALFQLVTLPVEFNASSRALQTLESQSYLQPAQMRGAKSVLRAAALTYVAALLVTVMQLIRLFMISRRRDD